MPKLVNIRLFKDNRNYAGDVFVSVNGESYLIQRGVTVAVPEYIAEVLESSQREDENAAEAFALRRYFGGANGAFLSARGAFFPGGTRPSRGR